MQTEETKIEFVHIQRQHFDAIVKKAAYQAVKEYAATIPPIQEVFTKEEAASFLRLLSGNGKPNTQAIDRLRREGKLKAVEDAKTVRITRKALENYLKEYESVI